MRCLQSLKSTGAQYPEYTRNFLKPKGKESNPKIKMGKECNRRFTEEEFLKTKKHVKK